MPDPKYDNRAPWSYTFPVPAVNLAVTETAVGPGQQVRCVGVDGRRRGSLRRFPGFRLIRDLSSDISGLANVERFWYVSIQKGATPYVLRGFVVLADSATDSSFKALYFVAFDTQDSVWRNYTLEDFAVNDRIEGVRVTGYWPDDTVTRPIGESTASFRVSATAAYVRDRAATYLITLKAGGSDPKTGVFIVDPGTGTLLRRLTSSGTGIFGMAYHEVNKKLYGTHAVAATSAFNELFTINLDTGLSASVANYNPQYGITDLAYQSTGNILWGVRFGQAGQALIAHVNPTTAVLTNEVSLSVLHMVALEFDNTNNVLYGMTSRRTEAPGNPVNDVKLFTINTTTGVCTEVFNFQDTAFKSDRAPTGRPEDNEKGSIVIPPNSGVIYIFNGQTGQVLELDLSSGPRTYDSVDVTSTWRYIYATFEARDVRRQLNRAYFWNPDTATVEGRHAGFLNSASLEGDGVTEQDGLGVIGASKRVSAAYRLVSRRHAIASPISRPLQVTTSAATPPPAHHVRLQINTLNLPTDLPIEDLEVEVYRTIGTDGDLTVDDVPLLGNLYRDSIDALLDLTTVNKAFVFGGRSGVEYANAKSDRELTARLPFNFTLQHVGVWPRTALVRATDDQVFVVAKPFLGDDPATRVVELSEKASWRVMWSPPERYELENFRGAVTGEQYRFPDAQATIFALERVGDFLFACTDLGVIRFHKSGSYVAVNPLSFKWGIQGRDAATSMGNQLMLATSVGLIQVDGPTMQERGVAAVQRLLASTEFWRADLANVHLSYDAQLGALILLNTVKNEMYLLWPDTGAVTSLEDCPWIQSAEGVDPENGGSPRSFWITSDGRVHTPDAEETSPKKTMYGGGSSDTVNGTATGGTTTTLTDSGAVFASNAKGFQIHFLSGANIGSSRPISSITGGQQRISWTSPLNTGIASGDRYAVAPIPFRPRGHQLVGQRGLDMFIRKIVTGMSANIELLGGEDTTTNPNLKMTYKMYRHLADSAPATVEVGMTEDVTHMQAALQVQDTILFPEWVCLASNLDFQLLAGRVSGKISTSGSISSPSSIT